MSVIVLGMEMPSGCQHCVFSDDESRYCKAAKEYIPMLSKPEFCPLRPLPEKHGDLIDRDAMLFSVLVLGLEGERAIETAPVIVEAEGD